MNRSQLRLEWRRSSLSPKICFSCRIKLDNLLSTFFRLFTRNCPQKHAYFPTVWDLNFNLPSVISSNRMFVIYGRVEKRGHYITLYIYIYIYIYMSVCEIKKWILMIIYNMIKKTRLIDRFQHLNSCRVILCHEIRESCSLCVHLYILCVGVSLEIILTHGITKYKYF